MKLKLNLKINNLSVIDLNLVFYSLIDESRWDSTDLVEII